MSNYMGEEFCEIVHQLLDQLPKYDKKPSECNGKIPKNGIYFWYENGETRNGGRLRITRVGINKKQDRLHGRINEHYTSDRVGSSFRKDIGAALMSKNGESVSEIKEWRKDRKKEDPRFKDPKFVCYNSYTTQELKQHFSYCVLKIDDLCERSVLEIRLISLFSNCNHCLPTCTWLGKYSDKQEIRDSGLWNKDYVFCAYKFNGCGLDRLKELFNDTLNYMSL